MDIKFYFCFRMKRRLYFKDFFFIPGKVRSFIMCCLCGKRRVVYCKERLSRQQITDIEEVQDSLFYTCGSTLFPTGHRYHETIVVKYGLECTAEMETTYYAGI